MAAALNLINSICKNGDIYVTLTEDPEIFGEYQETFEKLRDYYTKYRAVPSAEILQQMDPEFEITEAPANTEYYLSELKREYVSANLRNLLLKSGKFLQEGRSPLEITDGLQAQLAKLQRLSTTAKDLDIMDLDAAREHFELVRKQAEENGGTVGIPTGFKGIDSVYTTGMAPEHVIYAIGFSSHGKTWWASKMAEQAWRFGRKPLVISLEMSPEDMRNRIYTMIGEGTMKNSDLQRGIIDEEALSDLGRKSAGKTGFIVASGMEGHDITPNFCQAKYDQHHPDILIFDYQQLAMDNAKSPDMVTRMMNFSREMKLFAKMNKIPVIIISAVTDKESGGRQRPPDLGSLAWGRSLEYTADMVIAVHKNENGLTEFVMRKNRFGELGDMFVKTDYNSGIFEEVYDDQSID